jgi:tol-pal system protein YbgF
MIRRRCLPRIHPTLILVLLTIGATTPQATAQDATTQERLDRLERDLSMLQRQVYRDGVSPGDAANAAPGDLAADTQIRMQRLEQEMRELTGKVEDEANAVQQLRQRLEQVNGDIAVRLGEQNLGSPRPPPAALPPRLNAEGFSPGVGHGSADLPGMPPPGAVLPPPDRSGTLTPPGPPGPAAMAAAVGGGPPPPRQNLPSQSASAQFNSAFGLLRQADYPAAAEAFRSFVQQHPNSSLAGNAQYWLGESYYFRGQYADSAVAFAEGYRRYPKGPKAPDTLLKLAMALGRANQKQNACIALSQLDHAFPRAANAVKEQAASEKKRFGC